MSVQVESPSRRIEKVFSNTSPSGSETVQITTCVPGDGTTWLLRKFGRLRSSSLGAWSTWLRETTAGGGCSAGVITPNPAVSTRNSCSCGRRFCGKPNSEARSISNPDTERDDDGCEELAPSPFELPPAAS